MSAHRLLGVLAVWCALAFGGGRASAQTTLFPVQNLAFGQLTPGVPGVVPPSDVGRRAELDLQASGSLIVTINVPGQLTSMGGSGVPLSFSTTDAVLVWRRNGREFPFNPNLPYSFSLPRGQNGALIYLGGTAVPSPTQLPGQYSATITVTITPAGV